MFLEDFAVLALVPEPVGRVLPDRLQHPVALVREAEEALLDERLQACPDRLLRPPPPRPACSHRRRPRALGRRAAPPPREGRSSRRSLPGASAVAPRHLCRPSTGRVVGRGAPGSVWARVPWCGQRRARRQAGGRPGFSQSSAISAVASSRERSQKSATASLDPSGGTEYSTSPCTRSSSRLVHRSVRFGQACTSSESSGAASMTCSRLSRRRSISRSPMCSASPSRAPSVWAIFSVTSEGSRRAGEADPEDTRLVRRDELGRSFQSEAGLPGAAWPGEREQACSIAELAHNLFPLSLATDERARWPRQVRVRDRLERREGLLAELIDGDRALDVLQAVFPEVSDREPLDELASRLREQDLTTVARCCDTRGEVHVVSHVALVGDERGARVQADAQADRPRCESVRDRLGGSRRSRSGWERNEEGVPLRVYFDAALGSARLAYDPAMLGERFGVCLCAELAQKARRSLDVGEEEGDGAGRQIGSHAARSSAAAELASSSPPSRVPADRYSRSKRSPPFPREVLRRRAVCWRDSTSSASDYPASSPDEYRRPLGAFTVHSQDQGGASWQ